MADQAINFRSLGRGRSSLSNKDVEDFVTAFNKIVTLVNALKADIAGINAKLDADTGVTDTDYAATWDAAEADADTISEG